MKPFSPEADAAITGERLGSKQTVSVRHTTYAWGDIYGERGATGVLSTLEKIDVPVVTVERAKR